jgi:hypothetical protein
MRTAKTLTLTLAAAATAAFVSLVLLLVATPPRILCGTDNGPTTPGHSGRIAFICLVYSLLASLVALGLRIGAPRESATAVWARRGLVLGLLGLLVAAGAVFVVVARWTCWE